MHATKITLHLQGYLVALGEPGLGRNRGMVLCIPTLQVSNRVRKDQRPDPVRKPASAGKYLADFSRCVTLAIGLGETLALLESRASSSPEHTKGLNVEQQDVK